MKLFELLRLVALINQVGSRDGGYAIEERPRESRKSMEEPRIDQSRDETDKKLWSQFSIILRSVRLSVGNERNHTSAVTVSTSRGSEIARKSTGSLRKWRDEDKSSLSILGMIKKAPNNLVQLWIMERLGICEKVQ